MGARAGLSDKGNTPAVGEVDGALLRADRAGGGGAERFARGSAMLQLNAEGGHFGFHLPREPAADQVGRRGVHPARAGDLQHGVAAARIQFEHLRVFGFDAPREPRAGQVEQVRFPFLLPGGSKSLGAANRSRGGCGERVSDAASVQGREAADASPRERWRVRRLAMRQRVRASTNCGTSRARDSLRTDGWFRRGAGRRPG